MLKALELIGFKSFADKTRFEFPPGITVVVGPNGSGKSNIVDGIKWVLGAQSAKSLRGKEMADIIFKGAGGSGRRAMNTAEATIIFENADSRLAVDAPEVHVTRRVYRSGEGEYMINGQPCRLRDIKDMFSGTGVGTDAYSLIEQGKVDTLLQASPRDRRAIFEEAAGISRFKAKKVEAQRRLERVDQNLLRLSDIVDEVESRLRSVRSQAAKARRYKEYSDRLQELRTQVGLVDWRHLAEQLAEIEAEMEELRQQVDVASAQAEAAEARSLQLTTEIDEASQAIHTCEGRIARNRESIAARESSIDHERRSCRDLDDEIDRRRTQLALMNTRAGDLKQQLSETTAALERAETGHREISRQLADHERALSQLTARLDALRGENEARRDEYVNRMRARATLGNQVSACESELAAAGSTVDRCRQRLDELIAACRSQTEVLEKLKREEQRRREEVARQQELLQSAHDDLAEQRRQLARKQQELAELQGRHAGAVERAAVIEELENRLEGLGSGVKEVLLAAKKEPRGPFADTRGMVADLITVNLESAPLVEVALGETAQHVVTAGDRVVQFLTSKPYQLSGRVGFLPLTGPGLPPEVQRVNLEGRPGVIGRADRFVQTESKYAPLIERLLGDTWFVETLSHAMALRRSEKTPLRFITAAGEMLTAGGVLIVGPRHSGTGIISRRSELRALQERIADLQQQIDRAGEATTQIQQQIGRQEESVRQLGDEHRRATAGLSEHRARTQAADERCQQLQKERETVDTELNAAEARRRESEKELDELQGRLTETDAALGQMDAKIREVNQQTEQLEAQRQQRSRQATDSKVQMAKSEQRLEGLRVAMSQFEENRKERTKAIVENRTQLAQCVERRRQAERNILRASSEVAELYLRKEALARETVRQIEQREALSAERTGLAAEVQKHRRHIHRLEEKQHEKDLAAGEVRHQASSLADRLREDYGIELAELKDDASDEQQDEREAVDEEIASLRRKISNIGAVNMDALAELEALDARFSSLSSQYQDLTDAKESLEKIINKINADSRRLFTETLDAVRENFQGLFRKVFGGGKADIVLEEDVDVLESGVEIIATPPGKHSLSISLLSGGERALTAVTLLLAIFQYRPSPFCVLDEVDGPLDEANIGRFIEVLNEFLTWTRFVIVTHSKKTMTAATTLYGVTMQESGVSKRVSVQFDDVSEQGQISREALKRDAQKTAGEEEAA